MCKQLKTPLRIDEQVELLKSRGLIIQDVDCAYRILSRVNYYRLSAYSLSLRDNDIFKAGTTLEQIYQLYQFDAKLRQILFSTIESIEIKYRAMLSYYLAVEHGPMSYYERSLFHNASFHNTLIEDFENEKIRQRKNAFVKHHNEVYDGNIPIWAAIELFSFGMLSMLYANLKIEYQRAFVRKYLHKNKYFSEDLKSWLKCLVEIRNICAHYGPIYNRKFNNTPKMPPKYKNILNERIFPLLIVIIKLIDNYDESTTFITNFETLIEEYSVVNLNSIGFPPNWQTILKESRS